MSTWCRLLGLTGLAALVLVGCGDDGDDAATTTDGPTTAESTGATRQTLNFTVRGGHRGLARPPHALGLSVLRLNEAVSIVPTVLADIGGEMSVSACEDNGTGTAAHRVATEQSRMTRRAER